MFRWIKYFAIAVAVFTSGCRKLDLETPQDGTPIFSAKATLNGTAKEWQAGVNGIYLFTSFEKGIDEIYVFSGQLKKDSCTAALCGESLMVKIRDSQLSLNGPPDVAQAVVPGNYQYKKTVAADTVWVVDSTTSYHLAFDAGQSVVPPNSVPLFNWSLSNGTIVPSGKMTSLSLPQWPQNLWMTLTLAANNQTCTSTQTRRVALPNPNGSPESCSVFIDTLLDSTGTFVGGLLAVPSGQPPFSFAWQDSTLTQTWNVSNINPAIDAMVNIADGEGCTAFAGFAAQWVPGTIGAFCSARFGYQVTELTQLDSIPVVVNDSLQLSTVVVEYTDEAGILFSSVFAPQSNVNSYFEILSVEDYDENENGQKTKKLTLRFACRLWSASGAVIDMENGEAVMGVAYP